MKGMERPSVGGGAGKVAGGLLVAVGLLNGVFGLLSLVTDQVRLGAGISAALVVAGVVTAAVGAVVWRGNALVTRIALTVFALLLVVQLSELVTATDDAGARASRSLVLLVIVASLGWAAWAQSRGRRSRTAGH